MRYYLTIEEFNQTFKYLPGRGNVIDSLPRNVPVGVVTNHHPLVQNYFFHELSVAQRNHGVWSKIIYALESGNETNLPALLVPFKQVFLSDKRNL